MKWKRIFKVYGVTFVVITLSLLIAPVIVQGIEGSKVFPASKAEHVYDVTMVSQSWQRTDENSINFALDTRTIKRTYELKMYFEAAIHEHLEKVRCTNVTFDVYSNGVYVDQIRHDFCCGGCSGGGAFGPLIIPSETFKVGDNTVQIQINIKSNTSAEIPGTGTFHFVVKDIRIQLSPVDTDGDGLYNYLDPVNNFNNLHLSVITMIVLFPPITATGIERKKQ